GRGGGGGGGGGGGWRGGGGASQNNGSGNTGDASGSQFIQISQASQQRITNLFDIVPGPYRGWKLYFHLEGFAEGSVTVRKVRAAETFIKKHRRLYPPSEIEERRSFALDLKTLSIDDDFISEWPTFKDDLDEEPEHTLGCLGLGMHQVVLQALEEETRAHLTEAEKAQLPPHNLPAIRARILNHEPVLQLKTLKANYYGKLVSIRGTVIRVGNLKLLSVWMAFSCNTCGSIQCVRQPQGKYTLPSKCSGDNCRSRSYAPKHSSPFTQTVNYQSIKVQEIADDEHREGGRVPRNVEVELMEDLVDSCVPGDVVNVTGIMRVHNTEETIKQKNSSMFLLYIEAASIMSSKTNTAKGKKSVGIEFNMKDYYAIQEIHSEPSLFRLLVNSLCPTIFGHEVVKAGLLLGLAGGSHYSGRDSRCDAHILVVGDPGLGKSQMLQACASVAPRGVYVCGNTSTTSGLTVTLSRESGGDYALEAGALVLADQGSCCIDEFDKMSTQHQALLEAMEQQSISIAKAGVVCSLPARTSILAAANPVSGHYNRAKTVSENLRMGQPLLSRFDLIFILMDQPNEHLDNLLSEHVMALHSGIRSRGSVSCSSSSQSQRARPSGDGDIPLSERLRLYPNEAFDPIPHQLLRKYIAYARKYVCPSLSEEAGAVIRQFYLDLRKKHHTADSTPVTTRQLESLIRLTEARAKLELRETASEQDALEVIEIFRYSLVDSFADELGVLDFNRSQNGSGMSSRNKAKKFIAILQRRSDIQSKVVFDVSEMKEVAQTCGVHGADFFDFVNTLNTQGFLLKKGKQFYQLLSGGH
ncbi:DNA helicase MCM8-like, partial [Thrips palmi]|uniref:DNA helicase MCM8 n=1 Tax=Thrips palmi TaxID=161013 RepID=A0A6P8YXX4_THRPL